MADEIELSATLAYEDDEGTAVFLQILNLFVDVSSKKITRLKQSVGTSEEAIILGEVTSLGWAIFKNLDETNYVEIRVGTGGTKIIKMKAGEFAIFRFGSGITAPYWIANTAACQVDMLIVSD